MPIIFEPGEKNVVVLDVDEGKDVPPGFIVRALSMRNTRKLTKVYDEIWLTATNEENGDMFERLFNLLSELICDWVNFEGGYKPEKLWDVLTFTEARELAVKILNGQYTSYKEKKT